MEGPTRSAMFLRGDGDSSGVRKDPIVRASLSKLRSRLDILPTDLSGMRFEILSQFLSSFRLYTLSFRLYSPGDALALGIFDSMVFLGDFLPIEER